MGDSVLVADDDRAIRASLRRALELAGHEVVEASDGAEALALARGPGEFDVLLLDVAMPWLDGFAVCRALRADGIDTPVLMVSAAVESADRTVWEAVGADDFMRKPFDLDGLLHCLRRLAHRSRTYGHRPPP